MTFFTKQKRNPSFYIFLFFLIITSIVGFGNAMSSDEGIITNGAMKLLSGERIYTDFFEFISPGSFFLAALFMSIFGAKYWSIKAVAIILIAGSAYALADIAKRIGVTEKRAIMVSIIWIIMIAGVWFQTVNHNALSSAIAVIGVALFIRAIDQKTGLWSFFGSGIVIGLVPVFLQTKGLLLVIVAICISAVLVLRKVILKKNGLFFIFGMLLPLFIVLSIWSPVMLLNLLILWPAQHYREVNQVSILPLVIIVTLFVFLFWRFWKRADPPKRMYGIIIAGAQSALFLSVITRPDVVHVSIAAFALPIMAGFVWKESKNKYFGVNVGMILFQITVGFSILFLFCLNVLVHESTKEHLARIRFLSSKNGTGIYAYPFNPGYAFELGLKNPYPYAVLFTNMNTPDQFDANLDVLKRERPMTILRGRPLGNKFGYDWKNSHDQWINKNYRYVETVGGIEVLARISNDEVKITQDQKVFADEGDRNAVPQEAEAEVEPEE